MSFFENKKGIPTFPQTLRKVSVIYQEKKNSPMKQHGLTQQIVPKTLNAKIQPWIKKSL